MSVLFIIILLVILYYVVKSVLKNKHETYINNNSNVLFDIIDDTHNEYEAKIESQLKRFENALAIKRKQLIYIDDYGDRITSDWEREINRFINSKLETLKFEIIRTIKDRFEEIYPWGTLEDWEDKINDETIEKAVTSGLTEIIERVAESSIDDELETNINLDDPVMFEHSVAEIFEEHGWDVRVTKGSGDQGADVIAESNIGTKIVVQCKLYNKPVGNKAVQEVYSANKFYEGDQAMVVTNSSYTKSAKQLADSLDVMLFHYSELAPILQALNDRE